MQKLAIISTHPIQYNAPLFKMLAQRRRVQILVFYTWGKAVLSNKYDPGFGTTVEWDIPLLEGYDHCFVKNVATDAGSHHFKGIDNPTLINEIEQWDPAAILIFGWSFKSHLQVLKHFKGRKKILFRGDSTLLDESAGFSIKKMARRVFLKWVYGHTDKALYVGTANKEYYLQHGLKTAQLVFAPHAIDNERFMLEMNSNFREVLNIPPGALVFIFTGKFEKKKDPQLLLEAFIRLADKNTNTCLLIVGNGELEPVMKAIVSQQPAEISNRIHFMPFQNQLKMPEVYRSGDVLVLPSQGPGETWGLAVNEAMACSKAVLVSDKCGCAANLVEEGKNGYVFKSGDGNDLLKKMNMLLQGHSKITAMGKRSLEIIQPWRFEKICIAIEGTVAGFF